MCSFCKDIKRRGQITYTQDKYVCYSFKDGLRYKESEFDCAPNEAYPAECDETKIWLTHEGDAIFLNVENSDAGTLLYFEVLRCPFCGRDLTKELIC